MVVIISAILLITLFFFAFSASRKGSSAVREKPKLIQSFTTNKTPASVLKSIIIFGQQSGYRVEFLDDNEKTIVLGDSPSFFSWGFFYPIYLTDREGQTLVEVGIKSKLWQPGRIRARLHDKCFYGIKAATAAAL